MPNIQVRQGEYLYLDTLWQNLAKIDAINFYYPSGTGEKRGLTNLLADQCGKPKYMGPRLSMWNARPLREEQLKYAADDVYCLHEIYHSMRNKFNGGPTKFDEIVQRTMTQGAFADPAGINWKFVYGCEDDEDRPVHPLLRKQGKSRYEGLLLG